MQQLATAKGAAAVRQVNTAGAASTFCHLMDVAVVQGAVEMRAAQRCGAFLMQSANLG
jgi:hypothetical protein